MDGGDPGPGRRLRGQESTSSLSPPPGFRTTDVGSPRPRPPPTHTPPRRPRAAPRPRPGRAVGGGEAFRRPPGSGSASSRRRRGHRAGAGAPSGLEAPPHHPGPRRRPGDFGGPRRRRRGSLPLPVAVDSAFSRLPLLSPVGPEPREQAQKPPGRRRGLPFRSARDRSRTLPRAPATPPRQALWRTQPDSRRAPHSGVS